MSAKKKGVGSGIRKVTDSVTNAENEKCFATFHALWQNRKKT